MNEKFVMQQWHIESTFTKQMFMLICNCFNNTRVKYLAFLGLNIDEIQLLLREQIIKTCISVFLTL